MHSFLMDKRLARPGFNSRDKSLYRDETTKILRLKKSCQDYKGVWGSEGNAYFAYGVTGAYIGYLKDQDSYSPENGS